MGLATAALRSGDGEWENIQGVLRNAFLIHENELRHHGERLDGCERHSNELSAKWADLSETLAKLQGLPTHVDKLARVVNTLTEELQQRAQAEQEKQQQQAKWEESLMRAVETQLNQLQTRITSDMEITYKKTLATLERRMELLEEELGHFVVALEQKAELEDVKTHRHATEEALKQRCRKVAFDKEVLRVHQLLRSQHAQINQQIKTIQGDLQQQLGTHLETQQQQLRDVTSDAKGQTVQQQQLRDEIMDTITEKVKSVDEALTLNTQAQVKAAQQAITRQVEALVIKQGDLLLQRLQERDIREKVTAMGQEWSDWRQLADIATREVAVKISTLHVELTTALTTLAEQIEQHERNHSIIDVDIEKRFTQVQEEQRRIQLQTDQAAAAASQYSEQAERWRSNHAQQQLAFQGELQTLTQAREKKTRQQMHVVADKLREMDQILKLVGKQLVQNTSQLQLLWVETLDDAEDSETELKLLQDDRIETAGEADPTVVGDGDVLQRSSHQQLQTSIAATLRDYETVLSTNDATTSGNTQTSTLM